MRGLIFVTLFISLFISLFFCVACDRDDDHDPDPAEDVMDVSEDSLPDTDDDVAPDLPAGPTVYGPPTPWSEPIFDYIQKVVTGRGLQPSEFDHSLKELAVFEDRLYIGYGDWTVNTGPVDIRHFEPDGGLVVDLTIDEESIDYYRIFGDRMFIPGVDPRQPAGSDPLTGNVFTLDAGATWIAAFELEQCLHVLDVIPWGDTIFACGSGNIDMDHYHAGDDMSVIWRSDDGGHNWELETTWHDDNTDAVARWKRFIRTGDDFVVFGQTIDYVQGVLSNIPRRYDGGAWTPVDLLPDLWVSHTVQWNDDAGLVWGPDLGVVGKRGRVFQVSSGPAAEPVPYFEDADLWILDVFRVGDEDLVFLGRGGASTEVAPEPPYTYQVLRTQDLETFDEIAAFEHDELFLSIALWQDKLYLGGWEGGLWECQ